MKILAIKWRRLGDTVLWTSALQALRDHFPKARIDIAFAKGYGALFEKDPRFAKLWPLEAGIKAGLKTTAAWRRENYDLALVFHANQRTRWLVSFVGRERKILHHHSRKPNVFGSERRVVDLGKVMPANERDLNVVRTLGWNGATPATKLHCPESWVQAAREKMKFTADKSKPTLLVSTGASRPAKQWALEKYAALCRLAREKAHVGVVFESPRDFTSATMQSRIADNATLVATPDLPALMGALSLADCYVGSDSGVKHVACALGVPTVTLFGPESLGEWHFYDPKRHPVVQRQVSCRFHDADKPEFAWCGEWACPLGSHACLNLISPDDVFAKIEPFL